MPTNYLFLTGGLGNQLFQYSALISDRFGKNLVIDIVNGNPRLNESGIPDLLEFQLKSGVAIHKKKMMRLTQKSIGYNLRSHLAPRGIERYKLWQFFTRLASSLLVSLHIQKFVFLQVPRNLGNDTRFSLGRGSGYLAGYFQSTRWANSFEKMSANSLHLKAKSVKLSNYIDLLKTEKPLIVHIRLGDYLSESGFGIPGAHYYENAITTQLASSSYEKIWLFSDSPEMAVAYLPDTLQVPVRVVDSTKLSSAETLELMRYGAGYVIGNSTFSWWGAFLSHSKEPKVIFPQPWFKHLVSPNELIPPRWESLDANF